MGRGFKKRTKTHASIDFLPSLHEVGTKTFFGRKLVNFTPEDTESSRDHTGTFLQGYLHHGLSTTVILYKS